MYTICVQTLLLVVIWLGGVLVAMEAGHEVDCTFLYCCLRWPLRVASALGTQ
jgi:hypothetical protein